MIALKLEIVDEEEKGPLGFSGILRCETKLMI